MCGDGILHSGEDCEGAGETCAVREVCRDCMCVADCYDGIVEAGAECDQLLPDSCPTGESCGWDGGGCACRPECNDERVGPGEECDGNSPNTCPAGESCLELNCTCATVCGDRAVGPGEQCELDLRKPCPAGESCRPSDCTCGPACGDRILGPGEECEPDVLPTTCPTGMFCSRDDCTCRRGVCGNLTVGPGEECEPFSNTSTCPAGESCGSSDCTCRTVCGDGLVGPGEQCELALRDSCPSGEGCQFPDCTCGPVCGDGLVGAGEVCDPAAGSSSCPPGQSCRADCRGCAAACADNPANPIANCGFETADFRGWVAIRYDASVPLSVVGSGVTTGFFPTAPTEGSFAVVDGFAGEEGALDDPEPGSTFAARLEQDVTLWPGAAALTFDYRAAWNLLSSCLGSRFAGDCADRHFVVAILPVGGGLPLQKTLVLTAHGGTIVGDTGPLRGRVDVRAFAGTAARVVFAWFGGDAPALFQLDNVNVIGCGDGVVQDGERCDDGNTAEGDCCSATCQREGTSPCAAP